ncbi:T9SS type A sorting domain-containing protein [Flavobacterium sp.]|jgi:alpha-tubulin suppressor-like RCC1 family protein|uniref:T9SS type A sorting domain-containing protein n=1 Tax=Flavobacterium sp. TaxID=239 RepID=UPI0037BF41B6
MKLDKKNFRTNYLYYLFTLILFNCSTLFAQCWLQIASASYNQGFYSAGIQVDGTLWCWGQNNFGQLGDGTTTDKLVPTQVGTDTDWATVALGINSTYAIKQNGTLWAWGSNSDGQLGDGTNTGRLLPAQVLPGTTWLRISAGEQFMIAQKSDGTLWSCGNDDLDQLGRGTLPGDTRILLQISSATDWSAIKCQLAHTLLEKPNQTVWGFGHGDLGKLATGTNGGYSVPSQLLPGTGWVQATPGSQSSFFKNSNGTIWGCGQNGNGNLGIGNNTLGIYTLTQIGTATDWRSVEPSSVHTMALRNNGSLWAAGFNTTGQLGIGTLTNTNVFVQVGTATNWAKVRCGRQHTLALDSNGTLWAWGLNSSGQLGDGTTVNKSVPTQIGTVCTLSVNEVEKKVMQLLTNPVENQVQLSFAYDGVKQVTIYNTQGQAVRTQTVSQDFTSFDVSGFAAGVYFIQCISDMGNQTVKMVKK